ncbi:uncharacterized protein O3C94_006869 [Discoglossus pictus]
MEPQIGRVFMLFLLELIAGAPGHIHCPSSDKTEVVTFYEGESVRLPCNFSLDGHHDDLQFVWQKTQDGMDDLVVHFQNGKSCSDRQSEQFHGKTSVRKDWIAIRDATLTLSYTSAESSGLYTGYITRNPPVAGWDKLCCKVILKNVTLTVMHYLSNVTGSWTQYLPFWIALIFFFIAIVLLIVLRLTNIQDVKKPSVSMDVEQDNDSL